MTEKLKQRPTSSLALTPPRVGSDMIPRTALFNRLNSNRDLTIVQGPIGAGKTTLLAAWAAQQERPVLWWEAGTVARPAEQIMELAAGEPGILVIDNAERLSTDDLRWIGGIVNKHPHLQVAIATRTLDIAQTIARMTDATLDMVTAEELLFTLEELRNAGVSGNEASREELLRRSQGLAVAVRAKLHEEQGMFPSVRERMLHQLREELADIEGGLEAASCVSLLPKIDRLIAEAWGVPDRVLNFLCTTGVSQWKGDWLHMHPYFRSVLFAEAKQLLPAGVRRELMATAVRVSLLHRDGHLALRTTLAIEDYALATDVAFEHMIELIEDRDTTYEMFADVPTAKLRNYPALASLLLVLALIDPSTRARGLQVLATQSFFQRLTATSAPRRERVVFQAFEAVVVRLSPFSQQALPMVRHAVREYLSLAQEDLDKLGRIGPILLSQLGISAFYLGDPALAERVFKLAEAQHTEAGRADRVDQLCLRAGLAAMQGDLPLAEQLLAEADTSEWPPGWREGSPAEFFHLGTAILAFEAGNAHAIDTHLEAAGSFADLLEHWPLFAYTQSQRDLLAGEITQGLLRLQRVQKQCATHPVTPFIRALLEVAEAHLRFAQGDTVKARQLASQAAKVNLTGRMLLGRIELAMDRPAAAALQARRVLEAPLVTLRLRFEAEILLACVALRMGLRQDATQIVLRITELMRTSTLRQALRAVPETEQNELRELLAETGVEASVLALVGVAARESETLQASYPPLTPREQTVLEALMHTGSLQEISEQLFVSRNTVKTQLRNVYRKLDVTSRETALARAAVLGLLPTH